MVSASSASGDVCPVIAGRPYGVAVGTATHGGGVTSRRHRRPRPSRRAPDPHHDMRSARVEDTWPEVFVREEACDSLAAVDRREKADTVATEVVEERRMAGMAADDADPAVVVAHQPVPVEVV